MRNISLLLVLAFSVTTFGSTLTPVLAATPTVTSTTPTKKFERHFLRESTKSYLIRALYPSYSVESIDKVIREEVDYYVKDFKMQAEDWSAPELPYDFQISYKTYMTDTVQTVQLQISQYTGGAHGSTFLKTMYFDKVTNLPITLDDLFKKDAPYLEKLSTLSYIKVNEYFRDNQMNDMTDSDWLASGLAPTPENFMNSIPMRTGVKIIFGQYQVTAYAGGMPEIFISNEELKDVLK